MAKATHIKKKQFNRAVAIMTAIIVLIVASISTTIAFLITGTDSITNVFTPSKVTTEVIRDDNAGTYSIKNTGDTEAYIRAAVVVNWKKTDGTNTVYADAPKAGVDYTIDFVGLKENGGKWIEKTYDNGEVLYYYTSPVAVGDTTSSLFSGVALMDGITAPEGYTLAVEVLGSGIQSTPYGVVEEKWGAAVDGNGSITDVN